MAKKIYDVRWVDGDGEQGYYVELSPAEVKSLEREFVKLQSSAGISEIRIDPIEKPWLLTKRQFLDELRNRYLENV